MSRRGLVRSTAAAAAAVLALALLAGCGRESSVPPSQGNAAGSETVRQDDVFLHATAVQTGTLPEQVVRRYGAARDSRTVLVVISLRLGDGADAKALTARHIEVSATDLLGRKQVLAMREMRDGELIDYVGVARIAPPETLRLDVSVAGEHGRQAMRFNRDFF